MPIQKKKIAVVGAGIAGLTCAYELQRAGHSVTVFEKESYVGGRMASREKAGLIFDIGADHLLKMYSHMQEYCKEFSIPWERMRFLKYGVIKGGKIVPPKACVNWASRCRLALQYFLTPRLPSFFNFSDLVAHDTQDAFTFMQKRTGHQVVDYLVNPFVSTYQFHKSNEVSKGALLGVMSSIKYNLSGWDLHRTKSGMSALPEAFAQRLNVKTATPVVKVCGGEHVTITSTHDEVFDAVVLASTANETQKMYTNPTPPQTSLLKDVTYSSTISISLRVARDLLPKTTTIWVPFPESQTVSAYINQAMKGEELVSHDTSLISVWLYEDFAKSIIQKSDSDIFGIVKKEFIKVCPWTKDIQQLESFDIQRWPYAMPKFPYGYLTRVEQFLKNGQGQQHIYLAGDYMNSLWTEGALRCGQRVAQQVITNLR